MRTVSVMQYKNLTCHLLWIHLCDFQINLFLEALKVIIAIISNDSEGQKKKLEYEKRISLQEVFLESVPSFLVLTYLMLSAMFSGFYLSFYLYLIVFL